MHLDVALLGFGNVNRALARLLVQKADVLTRDHDLTLRVTGIATHSHGVAIDATGLDLLAALDAVDAADGLDTLHTGSTVGDAFDFLDTCPADLILEATWLDPQTGQPATDYARLALGNGCHVVTANKGPVAYAYRELRALARRHDVGFFFESTVMDGAPILALGREALLATDVLRVRGILNSTTNYILSRLEEGVALADAVAGAQAIGVAEADPANDIDGWDAAVKITVLANVLMGAELRPQDVARTGIRDITTETVHAALAAGERVKLVCEAVREPNGVLAHVRPERLSLRDPLSQVGGTSSAVTLETDTLPSLTIVEGDTDPVTTAYGMLVDTINIARGRFFE